MALDEAPQPEIRREAIIASSPTMQALLARNITQPFLNDRYAAMEQTVIETHRTNGLLRRLMGVDELKSSTRNTIDMTVDNAKELLVTTGFIDLHTDVENKDAAGLQKRMCEVMFLVGFEMDDAEDARLIVNDVIRYLNDEDTAQNGTFFSDVGRDMLQSEDGRYFLRNMVYQIILFGFNMRVWQTKLPLRGESEPTGQNEPPHSQSNSSDADLPTPLDAWVEGIKFEL